MGTHRRRARAGAQGPGGARCGAAGRPDRAVRAATHVLRGGRCGPAVPPSLRRLPPGALRCRPAGGRRGAPVAGAALRGVPADPGAHRGERPVTRLVIEADGGSRGNPGPAGYGALVREGPLVLAERAEAIGSATNNVAEYRGLIAGLEAAREISPDAEINVRMDSKLVVEQMSGRWKVKHEGMRALAREAAQLVAGFPSVTFTWIPRAQNSAADALANAAMDE